MLHRYGHAAWVVLDRHWGYASVVSVDHTSSVIHCYLLCWQAVLVACWLLWLIDRRCWWRAEYCDWLIDWQAVLVACWVLWLIDRRCWWRAAYCDWLIGWLTGSAGGVLIIVIDWLTGSAGGVLGIAVHWQTVLVMCWVLWLIDWLTGSAGGVLSIVIDWLIDRKCWWRAEDCDWLIDWQAALVACWELRTDIRPSAVLSADFTDKSLMWLLQTFCAKLSLQLSMKWAEFMSTQCVLMLTADSGILLGNDLRLCCGSFLCMIDIWPVNFIWDFLLCWVRWNTRNSLSDTDR